jgi:hypothetical protein
VVQKKQSNVLDKPVGHKSSTVTAPVGVGNGGGGNAVSADIDIKKLTVCTPLTRFSVMICYILPKISGSSSFCKDLCKNHYSH